MVFNSAVFTFFFTLAFALHWFLGRFKRGDRYQNQFLLIASYIFYGYWDWLFLGLIWVSTIADYILGLAISRLNPQDSKRRLYLILSMVINLSILGTFKYFDFFITSFVDLTHTFIPGAFPQGGQSLLLQVILPVGISFYTFQTMSYTIDVYRGDCPAESNFIDFALFVCFFPQLVAGPIERAKDLIPQLKARRKFSLENVQKGVWLMLLGFFLKVYMADSLGELVDQVYLPGKFLYDANPAAAAGHGGFQVFAASVAFAFQIYGDFAGYSYIALGSAMLLGVRLTVNFHTPEMSRNPAEFWRRWHVTLNRWVMDYLYIPLGGSRRGEIAKARNLVIVFTAMGLWHGANWTFLIWGFFHGTLVVAYAAFRPYLPTLPESTNPGLRAGVSALNMAMMFTFMGLTATLFRAYDIRHTFMLWESLFSFPWDLTGSVNGVAAAAPYLGEILRKIWVVILLDTMLFRSENLFWIFKKPVAIRVLAYSVMFFTIVILGVFGKDVIYFAF